MFGCWGTVFANFFFLVGLFVTILVIAFFVRVILNQTRLMKYLSIGGTNQRHVMITGCDSGFGFDLACRLDKLGCHVYAACLTEAGQEKIRQHCSSRIHPLLIDVTRQDTIQAAYEEVHGALTNNGGLWAVVNNAGVMDHGSFIELDRVKNMKKVSDVNLWGMVAVTKTFLPLLKEAHGRIVNIASVIGKIATASTMSYAISKYGVEAFSDSLRQEMAVWGISVHIIEPGSFKTNLLSPSLVEAQIKNKWEGLDQATRDEYGEEWFESVVKGQLKTISIASPSTYKVVDCMEHAILAVKPKKRYYAGWDSALFFSWFSLVPAEITDSFIDLIKYILKMHLPKAIVSLKYGRKKQC